MKLILKNYFPFDVIAFSVNERDKTHILKYRHNSEMKTDSDGETRGPKHRH